VLAQSRKYKSQSQHTYTNKNTIIIIIIIIVTVSIEPDRNVIQKRAENKLRYKDLSITIKDCGT
jgi:hypothetical protein